MNKLRRFHRWQRGARLRFSVWWRLYRAAKLLRETSAIMRAAGINRSLERRIFQQFRDHPDQIVTTVNQLLTGIDV